MKRVLCLLLTLVSLFAFTSAQATATVMPYWVKQALTLPGGVELVESGAFDGVEAQYLVIPQNVEKICAGAFPGTTYPQKIAVCSSIVILEDLCFGTGGGTREIWGYAGSTAQTYASRFDFVFRKLDSIDVLLSEINAQVTKRPRVAYVHGKTDCVGFVRTCYSRALSINLPDRCERMYKLNVYCPSLHPVKITSYTALQPGDIICWTNDELRKQNKDECTHVGIYIGSGYPERDGYRRYYSTGVFAESSQGFGYYRFNIIPFNNPSDYYRRNFLCAWRILS